MSGRGEDPVDVEAAWAEIVARWEEPSGSHPAREDAAGGTGRPPEASPPEPGGTAAEEPPPGGSSAQAPSSGYAAAEQPTAGGPGAGAPDDDGPDGDMPDGDRPPAAAGGTAPGQPGRPGGAPRGWPDEEVAGAGSWRSGEPPAGASRPVDDDHYVPPPPAPSPPVGGLVRAAWVGALGGPVLLLVCALVWRGAPAVVVVVAVVAFVAGFGVLVSRLPRSRDDGDDDGAVV